MDPLAAPTLDPKYLSNDFGVPPFIHLLLKHVFTSTSADPDLLVAGFRQMEKVAATKPLKNIIQGQSVPPAPLTDDEAVKGYAFIILISSDTPSHPIPQFHQTGILSELMEKLNA